MTRAHDMGGRFGDGPVTPGPADEPVFATDWHARACAVTVAAGGLGAWSIDRSRFFREALAPTDYAGFSYYEKWLAGLADLLVDAGLVTREELAAGKAAPAAEPHPKRLAPERVAPAMAAGSPYVRPGPDPRFAVGARVRTRLPARNTLVEGGHTRLPAYAAGHVGTVIARHGSHVFPDASAHRLGEAPEPLYTLVFDAADLWGDPGRAGDEVTLDLWESYLEAVE
ncbi:nitrile hydratase subunit beta [Rhodovulum sp. DZ06]|uniref:nitrile hydratase subunit beta n=1 Tax=Rhodovulum sp. DZ06 TaxID=3425126 RepID=UPI003D33D51D